MKTYVENPIPIQAVQFTRENVDKVYDFTRGKLHSVTIPRHIGGRMEGHIDTMEGTVHVREEDYIIRGIRIRGEFYACDRDIFELTYSEITEKDMENY